MELLQNTFPWQDEIEHNASWECNALQQTPRCQVLSVPSALAGSSHLVHQYSQGLLDEHHASIMSFILSITSMQRLLLKKKIKKNPKFPKTVMVEVQFPDVRGLARK